MIYINDLNEALKDLNNTIIELNHHLSYNNINYIAVNYDDMKLLQKDLLDIKDEIIKSKLAIEQKIKNNNMNKNAIEQYQKTKSLK